MSEQHAVTFDSDVSIVPSATWERTTYRATPTACTCPARGHCHHKECAAIVADALAEDATIEVAGQRDAETSSLNWQVNIEAITPALRAARRVSYRAAQSSGIADLFV